MNQIKTFYRRMALDVKTSKEAKSIRLIEKRSNQFLRNYLDDPNIKDSIKLKIKREHSRLLNIIDRAKRNIKK